MKLVAQIQQGLEANLTNKAREHPTQHGHVVISARTVAKGKSTTLGAMRIKLTNMLSIFVDTTSPQAVRLRRTSFSQLVWENA